MSAREQPRGPLGVVRLELPGVHERTDDLRRQAHAPRRLRGAAQIGTSRRVAGGRPLLAAGLLPDHEVVTDELLEPLARMAVEDGCHATNPRRMTVEDFLRGYREAL